MSGVGEQYRLSTPGSRRCRWVMKLRWLYRKAILLFLCELPAAEVTLTDPPGAALAVPATAVVLMTRGGDWIHK